MLTVLLLSIILRRHFTKRVEMERPLSLACTYENIQLNDYN